MTMRDRERITAFRVSFARRQAGVVREIPGGVAVLDEDYPDSHEHNQLVIEGTPDAAELPALADAVLADRGHRHITVLDDATGAACAPALVAAGYTHATELVMVHSGSTAVLPGSPARPVSLADLRPSLVSWMRGWMPEGDDALIGQLADRRSARLRGADQVTFLAARDEDGEVCSWADLYIDESGTAQIEDLVTASRSVRGGYADTVLATALRLAAPCDLVFLIADPGDWPKQWYARRGFSPIACSHAFTRAGHPR